MAVVDLLDLPRGLAKGETIAGLDLGTKTIGVAVSDMRFTTASPLAVIRRRRFFDDADALIALMASRSVGALVIGLPINMDGTSGPRAQSTRAFARNLLKLKEVPVAFWDERLSTAAVERMLTDEADASRARRAEVVDKAAAAWILQGALDRIRRGALD
jgi:putative Holliday junction resolvase